MINLATTILAGILLEPMNIPTNAASLLWALPICIGIAVVYKAVKLEDNQLSLKPFIVETALLVATIIGFLILVAVVLLIIASLAWR
ncbi:MAG: hypothetical protein JW936_03330 [Sedimentisphaerales bacterium]|nr:hypothetical protein [Sedimentisphaerales bacterium]